MTNFLLTGLALLFIGLKLTGHITWSWWWVTSPLWAGLVLVFILAALGMLIPKLGEFLRAIGGGNEILSGKRMGHHCAQQIFRVANWHGFRHQA